MSGAYSGRCLCGAVRFTIRAEPAPPVACHCRECQRQSGTDAWISVNAPRAAVAIDGDVAWVSASPRARRGFCPRCGGFLFWEETGGDTIDIAFGALDAPPVRRLAAHIWCEEARLPIPEDGAPRHPRDMPAG